MALPVIEWDPRRGPRVAGRRLVGKGTEVRKLWTRLTAFRDLAARGRFERRAIREVFEDRVREERMSMFREHVWYPPG